MKKKAVIFFFVLINGFLLSGQFFAEEMVFKFVRNSDMTLGYDQSSPIPLYKDSSEIVTVPEDYTPPENNFQSAWVATINNLNIEQPVSEAVFKENYLSILETFREWNMNAMIFQVRPLLDAWYPSELNPWSEFLSGVQGVDPGYDPLQWMVDVTHQAGMEYHAWFNPYRVTNSKLSSATILNRLGITKEELLKLTIPEQIAQLADAGIVSTENYAVKNPEHVLQFDEKFFLNPGIPEVQSYVVSSVKEVIENYDIDAIHFDDYFYPYRLSETNYFGSNNEDLETFQQYGTGYTDIEAWRRDNITQLVSDIKKVLDEHNQLNKKAVQFGISPFGIWEHQAVDDRGSHTPSTSSKSYSTSIFSDTYKWVKEGLLDYIVPQIYWSFDQEAAPYGELVRWWNEVASGTKTQVYVGHANYKHVNNGGWETAWLNPEEIRNQIKFNQKYLEIKGSTLFSYSDILPTDINKLDTSVKERYQAKNEAIQLLKADYFNQLTLVPEKPWLSHQRILQPTDFMQVVQSTQTTLSWKDMKDNSTRFFVLYKGTGTGEEVVASSQNSIARLWKQPDQVTFSYTDESVLQDGEHYYLTAVDAAGIESEFTELAPPIAKKKGIVRVIYQTVDHKKLHEDIILEGIIGEGYEVEVKSFDGYQLIQEPI